MTLDVSTSITLAEGFSYMRRKVSLLNVFHADEIGRGAVEEVDFVVMFQCFGLKGIDDQTAQLQIIRESEDFEVIANAVESLLPGEVETARFAVVPFEGVQFPAPGRYNVAAAIEGEFAGQWPLVVKERA